MKSELILLYCQKVFPNAIYIESSCPLIEDDAVKLDDNLDLQIYENNQGFGITQELNDGTFLCKDFFKTIQSALLYAKKQQKNNL